MYNLDQFIWSNKDINVLGVTVAHEDILEKNFEVLIEKSKKTLKAWFNRGLSLLGKVQVINSLVSSLFVYKMMVMPKIPKKVVKAMENIFREFLWNGKKAKISLKILQIQKSQGGLNLVNLHNKDIALKTSWPKILRSESDYADLVFSIMRCKTLRHDIWRCSIAPEDVHLLRISNQFWEDVLVSWCEYNYYREMRVENQMIWYNSRVKIAGNFVFWKDICVRGLMYVHQLFENLKFKTYEQVYIEYGLTKLRYNSIKAALPQDWKNFFQTNPKSTFIPLPPHTYDGSLHDSAFSRKVYKFVSDDVLLVHNKYIRWLQDLGGDFVESLVDFGLQHQNIFRTTNIPKYRSFQYRLLQRALPLNPQLCKWGIKSTSLCEFCGEFKETIIHIMFECKYVQDLWREVILYLEERFGKSVVFSEINVILNRLIQPTRDVVNFLCLVAKQYIYSQKCLGTKLDWRVLKTKFREVESIEKYIAIKNGKLSSHQKKWNIVENVEDV